VGKPFLVNGIHFMGRLEEAVRAEEAKAESKKVGEIGKTLWNMAHLSFHSPASTNKFYSWKSHNASTRYELEHPQGFLGPLHHTLTSLRIWVFSCKHCILHVGHLVHLVSPWPCPKETETEQCTTKCLSPNPVKSHFWHYRGQPRSWKTNQVGTNATAQPTRRIEDAGGKWGTQFSRCGNGCWGWEGKSAIKRWNAGQSVFTPCSVMALW